MRWSPARGLTHVEMEEGQAGGAGTCPRQRQSPSGGQAEGLDLETMMGWH